MLVWWFQTCRILWDDPKYAQFTSISKFTPTIRAIHFPIRKVGYKADKPPGSPQGHMQFLNCKARRSGGAASINDAINLEYLGGPKSKGLDADSPSASARRMFQRLSLGGWLLWPLVR